MKSLQATFLRNQIQALRELEAQTRADFNGLVNKGQGDTPEAFRCRIVIVSLINAGAELDKGLRLIEEING